MIWKLLIPRSFKMFRLSTIIHRSLLFAMSLALLLIVRKAFSNPSSASTARMKSSGAFCGCGLVPLSFSADNAEANVTPSINANLPWDASAARLIPCL